MQSVAMDVYARLASSSIWMHSSRMSRMSWPPVFP
jgi:hypothetical protein